MIRGYKQKIQISEETPFDNSDNDFEVNNAQEAIEDSRYQRDVISNDIDEIIKERYQKVLVCKYRVNGKVIVRGKLGIL